MRRPLVVHPTRTVATRVSEPTITACRSRLLRDPDRVPKKVYEAELLRLQRELVKVQEWVRAEGARLVVIFEGRDAAGKGGAIKRVTEYLNPRFARIAALPAPTERERGQWYFQRYVDQLPAAGEIVLFDRSWYNRAGVEHVMGFCTPEEYQRFLHQCPIFERLLVEDGIMLRKYWFSVSDAEQERRFHARLDDPLRSWKLSPMDPQSIIRWEDYSRAKDTMMVHTDIAEAPLVRRRERRQAAGPAEHDRPPAVDPPVPRGRSADDEATEATEVDELPTPASDQPAVRPRPRRHARRLELARGSHDGSSPAAAGDDGMTIGGSMRCASIGRSMGSARCSPSRTRNLHRLGTRRTPTG